MMIQQTTASILSFPAPEAEPKKARERLMRLMYQRTGTAPGSVSLELLTQLYVARIYAEHGMDAFMQPVVEYREGIEVGTVDGTGELLQIDTVYGDDQSDEYSLSIFIRET